MAVQGRQCCKNAALLKRGNTRNPAHSPPHIFTHVRNHNSQPATTARPLPASLPQVPIVHTRTHHPPGQYGRNPTATLDKTTYPCMILSATLHSNNTSLSTAVSNSGVTCTEHALNRCTSWTALRAVSDGDSHGSTTCTKGIGMTRHRCSENPRSHIGCDRTRGRHGHSLWSQSTPPCE